jgi:hypothetical protein
MNYKTTLMNGKSSSKVSKFQIRQQKFELLTPFQGIIFSLTLQEPVLFLFVLFKQTQRNGWRNRHIFESCI